VANGATVSLTWQRPSATEVYPDNIYINPASDYCEQFYGSISAPEISYYKIGMLSDDNELVRADLSCDDDYLRFYYFTVDENDLAQWITNLGNGDTDTDVSISNTKTTLTITNLNPNEVITYNGAKFSPAINGRLGHGASSIFDLKNYTSTEYQNKKLVKLLTATNGDFYRSDSNFRSFFLVTPDQMIHPYYLPASYILRDDNSARVVWNNDKVMLASESWQNLTRDSGCGSQFTGNGINASIIDEPDASDLEMVGKLSENNAPIYALLGGKTLDSYYANYLKDYDTEWNTEPILSFEAYKNYPAMLTWQDELGEWNVLLNSNFTEMAECGKPVVYLYPETETLVDVKVGAQVTVSEPTYPQATGWEKVWAKPSGELTYQNEKYNSLFWEGLGDGEYPNVEGVGFVVTQEDLLPTIEKQLAQQGLNAKELADFMEFWAEHLPTTPYVKLTWLTTAQMNTLAPLAISPKPQTVIRVFLDARGLETPVTLREQKLTAPAREGFTVVEWGGLLYK
jgi:hypothetical protein